jgi:O-acetyl-ADP-ribose deacetylase (regulator of RNase III)
MPGSSAPANRLQLVQGDLTRCAAEAIVNAANRPLLGGGGVDGAIHRAAGPGLLAECRELGGCEPGQAKRTSGHRLQAAHVIHTVGPIWSGGAAGEDATLASCYRQSLTLARDLGVHTLAFPSISTGAFRFPLERAARIAVREILAFLATNGLPETVTLVCFDPVTLEAYRRARENPAT